MAALDTIRSDVAALKPFDAIEAAHRRATLHWLDDTDDVCRRIPPDTPARHLVVYCLLVDAGGEVLLTDHRKSGLWLPAGGHVEPGETPAQTARRETHEELGVDREPPPPFFLSVARTVPVAGRQHTDVSLWYRLDAGRAEPLTPDPREFRGVRWWSLDELRRADRRRFDPHFRRAMVKLQT